MRVILVNIMRKDMERPFQEAGEAVSLTLY
jgi:hypothetical protein